MAYSIAFSRKELSELEAILERELQDTQSELRRTDDRSFRAMVRSRREATKQILSQVRSALSGDYQGQRSQKESETGSQ
jgi:hypothetical protein